MDQLQDTEHLTTAVCPRPGCDFTVEARHGERIDEEIAEHVRGHLVWNREAPALLVWALVPVIVALIVAWVALAGLILGGGQ